MINWHAKKYEDYRSDCICTECTKIRVLNIIATEMIKLTHSIKYK
ncbi:hypothetical protein [Spiroplasma endosymbiont of Crioceris asparagi]